MPDFLKNLFRKNNNNLNISYQEYEIQEAKNRKTAILACIIIVIIIILLLIYLVMKKPRDTQQPTINTNHSIVQKPLVNPTIQIASSPASAPQPTSNIAQNNLNNTKVIPAQNISDNIPTNVKIVNTAPADPADNNTTIPEPKAQVIPTQTVQKITPITSATAKQVTPSRTKTTNPTRTKANRPVNRKKAVPTHSKKERKVPVRTIKTTNKTTQKLTAREVLRGKASNKVTTPSSHSNGNILIQAGAFKSESNAKAMQTKIAKLGYHSTIYPTRTRDGILYRVRVSAPSRDASRIASRLRQNKFDAFVPN